ncbi:hypothetical protein [Thermoleophilum album]|uniref:Serine/threonine-protein kinase RsbW n=1 Tax=Thermoleophilum album TaxID=29539 RepID=A0A1H6FUL2_THEAL|nr:hypothetical protein [Thermoleophilum album]SEH14102.1 hypothetical protein SAMN02745716_1504 [Thermoleophilum album]
MILVGAASVRTGSAGGRERVQLVAAFARQDDPMLRMLVGAIAARADLTLAAIDDLQLALETVLATVDDSAQLELDFVLDGERLSVRVAPLPARIEPLLAGDAATTPGLGEDRAPGAEDRPYVPSLAEVLTTLADGCRVERAREGLAVTLEKRRLRGG